MNIKKQYSIRDFGTPSVFSGTNILNISTDKFWIINGVKTAIKADRTLPATSTNIWPEQAEELALFNGVGPAVFQRNLELLNQRINAIHKELTYWDLYKLTASVDNAEDLEAIFSGLSIGQSMVINCPTFSAGGVQYSRGDVIVKTSDNEEIQIKALTTGLFYPSQIVKHTGNVYGINYNYFNGDPIQTSVTLDINQQQPVDVTNGLPSTINFTGLTDTPGNIYGYYFPINDIQDFNVLYENGTGPKYIRPIIKAFTRDNEEMVLNRAITITIVGTAPNEKWHIAVDSVPEVAYIQVK